MDYSTYDKGLDNVELEQMHRACDLGCFKIRGLSVAIDSLKLVLKDVEEQVAAIYSALGTAGMSSVRRVVGSQHLLSNHAWGAAIDLKIDGMLDIRGDNLTQYALGVLAPIFNKHGWYWGARFRKEDSMHFEVSYERPVSWQKSGLFGAKSARQRENFLQRHSVTAGGSPRPGTTAFICSRGDKGLYVAQLQSALICRQYNLVPDGRFGKRTELALVDFQGKHGLVPNGILNRKTALYLSLF